jgi:hypothetical protein
MLKNKIFSFTFLFILLGLVFAVTAQNKRNQRTKPADTPAVRTENQTGAKADPTPPPAGKKNSRPSVGSGSSDVASRTETPEAMPAFVYEFSQPAFTVPHILIEHDENGKGKITFQKKDFDDEFTDPIQLSRVTLDKLNAHFDALNFLESDEDYQYEKDFSHLGNVNITLRRDGKTRTARYNWTAYEDAKAIAGEYRKLANQYIWMFDITVARANQPLETPRIIKALEGYIKRNDISDPAQMIPFLKDLSDDERVPLITRNSAAKLIKEIEKQKNK